MLISCLYHAIWASDTWLSAALCSAISPQCIFAGISELSKPPLYELRTDGRASQTIKPAWNGKMWKLYSGVVCREQGRGQFPSFHNINKGKRLYRGRKDSKIASWKMHNLHWPCELSLCACTWTALELQCILCSLQRVILDSSDGLGAQIHSFYPLLFMY